MTYMRQLVVLGDERGGHCVAEEGRLSSSEVEAVVGRLSKVRVQAARFRSRCINIMSGSNLRIGRLTCVPHADTAIGAGGEEEPSARRVAQLDPLIDGRH